VKWYGSVVIGNIKIFTYRWLWILCRNVCILNILSSAKDWTLHYVGTRFCLWLSHIVDRWWRRWKITSIRRRGGTKNEGRSVRPNHWQVNDAWWCKTKYRI